MTQVLRNSDQRLVDAEDRARISTELDRNVLVEAAAGTGKTTELIARIVAVLAQGRATVDGIVAMTFTEKAAGEMKLRVRAGLERERQRTPPGSGEYRRLEHAIAHLEEAWVGTIHGFCAEILRERAVEAGVDPEFQVLTERQAEELFARAFRGWFEQVVQDPPPGIRRILRRRGDRDESSGPIQRLREAAWRLVEWRDFSAPWRREPFDRDAELMVVLDRVHQFADMSAHPADPRDLFYLDVEPARALSRDVRAARAARLIDLDRVEAELLALPRRRVAPEVTFAKARRGRTRLYGETVVRADVHAAHAELIEAIGAFGSRADADLATLLQRELAGAGDAYAELKRRRGRLDFVDLLLRARDLVLRRDVRVEFRRRFSHFFVDEFQDTDPLQAEILLLLVSRDPDEIRWERVEAEPGRLFLVGDPKQSIYRFRRADVGVYERVREQLARAGALSLTLTSSFRAVPRLQAAVNRAFAARLDGDREAQQANYVPLNPVRQDRPEQPALVALPIPGTRGEGRITVDLITTQQPRVIASFVAWLLAESGWSVTERDCPHPVPIEARHVCILFRRFGAEVTRPYVAELDSRGIRHLLVGGRSFHERGEVEAMRTALTAIEWPDDELSVFATLHGPLFAVGDEELLEYRHRHGRLHPFRLPSVSLPVRLEPVVSALTALAELHRDRNLRPIAETVHALLDATRAHAGFAFQPSGEQVLANVLHLTEYARAHERSGGLSFRGFVARLNADAELQATEEAPILEEGSEGIRLMTVHKAKGLEFPVVILADLAFTMTWGRASRYVDQARNLCALELARCTPWELREQHAAEQRRELAEGERIAYVAATRARDLLVVPAVAQYSWGEGKRSPNGGWQWLPCWLAPLNGAIYPGPGAKLEQASGCPDFTRVQSRDQDLPLGGVAPGRYRMDGYDVVWWGTLGQGPGRPVGVRRQELLDPAIDPTVVAEDELRHRAWLEQRGALIERATVPHLIPVPATARAAKPPPSPPPPDEAPAKILMSIRDHPDRPAGARFGTLVHAVLATIPLDAEAVSIRAACALQARILGATAAERESAERLATEVLGIELLDRARSAARDGRCRREVPITLRDPDGTIVEGQVDLAFEDEDGWTIVDFKTGGELDVDPDRYRRQVASYARAIATATGQKARGHVVRI